MQKYLHETQTQTHAQRHVQRQAHTVKKGIDFGEYFFIIEGSNFFTSSFFQIRFRFFRC